MKRSAILLVLLAILLLAGDVLAMSSPSFRLDWHTLLTSGGGGPAASGNYAVNFTIGQTAVGNMNSANNKACLGFWCGVEWRTSLYLPVIQRN
jgi:hypothetical protein